MTTLRDLRAQARDGGLTGYSRLRRAELEAALRLVEVHRGDLRATRRLGASYLRSCRVGQWGQRGRGRYAKPYPLSWLVPAGKLDSLGIVPVSPEDAQAKRAAMSAAARLSYLDRYDDACERIGARYGSRLVHAVMRGAVDEDTAELMAFKAPYRHYDTYYYKIIRSTGDRETARLTMTEVASPPADWPTYLGRYGFEGPEAEALARTLKDPSQAYPAWFKEAEIAVRRANLDLTTLTYSAICQAIADWRNSRYED